MTDDERLRLEMELEKLRLRLESLEWQRESLWARINGMKDRLAAKEQDCKPVE